MRIALKAAQNALSSGEFPVGCVMVYEDRVIATGYRCGTAGMLTNEIDHAEIVALKQLSLQSGSIDFERVTAFSTLEPCLMCYGALLIHGIGKIVYAYEDAMGGGTGCEVSKLPSLYRNARTTIIPNVLRKESLRLFKAFFSNPKNSYCRGSLLAQYTMAQ